MVSAGGDVPTLWYWRQVVYDAAVVDSFSVKIESNTAELRDVLIIKLVSMVEDALHLHDLNNMGAIGGNFVRAEGEGYMGERSKLVSSKQDTEDCDK